MPAETHTCKKASPEVEMPALSAWSMNIAVFAQLLLLVSYFETFFFFTFTFYKQISNLRPA